MSVETFRTRRHYRSMTRYFFHVFNDDETRDEEGQEFVDLAAARASAERACLALAADSITEYGHLVMHHRIEIEDVSGTTLDTVRFGDVVAVRP
jgi:hypothetical protein